MDLMLSGMDALLKKQNQVSGGYAFAVDQIDQLVAMPGLRAVNLNMKTLDDVVSTDGSLAPLRQANRLSAAMVKRSVSWPMRYRIPPR